MSWRPELAWTCPPRVVFDDLDGRDSNPQQRCHSKYQGRRAKDGRQPARGRTRQRAPAGKARRSETIRQANPNCPQSDRADQLFTPRPGRRGLPLVTPPPLLDGFGTQSARCPCDWPKGVPSPLIGLGGVAGLTADRPSNRKMSNIVLRWLPSAERRQTRSHLSDWSREPPSPSLNSAHRERYGIRMERGEGVVVVKAKM